MCRAHYLFSRSAATAAGRAGLDGAGVLGQNPPMWRNSLFFFRLKTPRTPTGP